MIYRFKMRYLGRLWCCCLSSKVAFDTMKITQYGWFHRNVSFRIFAWKVCETKPYYDGKNSVITIVEKWHFQYIFNDTNINIVSCSNEFSSVTIQCNNKWRWRRPTTATFWKYCSPYTNIILSIEMYFSLDSMCLFYYIDYD